MKNYWLDKIKDEKGDYFIPFKSPYSRLNKFVKKVKIMIKAKPKS